MTKQDKINKIKRNILFDLAKITFKFTFIVLFGATIVSIIQYHFLNNNPVFGCIGGMLTGFFTSNAAIKVINARLEKGKEEIENILQSEDDVL